MSDCTTPGLWGWRRRSPKKTKSPGNPVTILERMRKWGSGASFDPNPGDPGSVDPFSGGRTQIGRRKNPGNVLLSHQVALAVPLAMEGLTAVFGMGTGVTPPPRSPGKSVAVTALVPFLEGQEPHSRANDAFESLKSSLHQQYKRYGQASRPISTRQLSSLLALGDLHLGPINLVVFQGSLGRLPCGRSHLGVGFTLRCFQRLSLPNVATQRCHWRDNWCTRGSSIPVLSY